MAVCNTPLVNTIVKFALNTVQSGEGMCGGWKIPWAVEWQLTDKTGT